MNLEAVRAPFSCPQCLKPPAAYALACADCGADFKTNDPRSAEVIAKSINGKDHTVFFNVSPVKLIVMSIVTFGFYELFWFYKNWTYVKEWKPASVWPLARAIFRPLTYFWLLSEIKQAGESQGVKMPFMAAPVAICYLILTFCGRLDNALQLLGILGPLALLPAQSYINSLNSDSPQSRFSAWNWAILVIGGGLRIATVIGFLRIGF